MDLMQRKLWSREQEIVLQVLAGAVARPGCRFLEVGSWCGDSAVVLGKVARRHGGHLFCVDWWKGSVGTLTADIAVAEDVFAAFWERMKREGLEDVIVPIRARSAVAAQVLAAGVFDLVFLDADHRYQQLLQEIAQYGPLLRRDGGIFCGHDCEGRISDYDRDFLEAGKDVDCHEAVHCGVVLAIGTSFTDSSVNHGIWSVRRTDGDWEPTRLSYPEIADRRQPPPPPIGYSRSYNVHRYGRLVYAVPYSLGDLDITDDEQRGHASLISAPSLEEVEQRIGEKVHRGSGPVLVEAHQGYNIVRYQDRLFAFAHALGAFAIPQLSDEEIQQFRDREDCVVSDSIVELKRCLDELAGRREKERLAAEAEQRLRAENQPRTAPEPQPNLIEEGYHGFNIIRYHDLWYGLAQEEGAFDIGKVSGCQYRRCVAGDSVAAVKTQIRRRRLKEMFAGALHPVRGIARLINVSTRLAALGQRSASRPRSGAPCQENSGSPASRDGIS